MNYEISCNNCRFLDAMTWSEPCASCIRGSEPGTTGLSMFPKWVCADGKHVYASDPNEGSDEGVKYDAGKPRYDLIPPEIEEAIAQVLSFGASKYGARNWEKGMAWGRPYAALRRHMGAWWGGEDKDQETGMSHLWHAACCIAFLVTFEERGTGTDDRAAGGELK